MLHDGFSREAAYSSLIKTVCSFWEKVIYTQLKLLGEKSAMSKIKLGFSTEFKYYMIFILFRIIQFIYLFIYLGPEWN